MADGFLNRWSQRKAGQELPNEVKPVAETPANLAESAKSNKLPAQQSAPTSEVLPQLTLDDVAKLNHQDDFSVFMQSGVDPDVKRAALKKLFSDPRYNIMDGLDIYIDDYSKPDPIPPEMLRRLVQSKMLNLFKAEEDAQDQATEDTKEKMASEALDRESRESNEVTHILPPEPKTEVTEIKSSKPPLDPQLKT